MDFPAIGLTGTGSGNKAHCVGTRNPRTTYATSIADRRRLTKGWRLYPKTHVHHIPARLQSGCENHPNARLGCFAAEPDFHVGGRTMGANWEISQEFENVAVPKAVYLQPRFRPIQATSFNQFVATRTILEDLERMRSVEMTEEGDGSVSSTKAKYPRFCFFRLPIATYIALSQYRR